MNHRILNFKALDITDLSVIQKFTSKYEPYSDFSSISLFSWNTKNNTLFTFLNNNLVILIDDYDQTQRVISVIGEEKIYTTVKFLLEYANKNQYISNELKFIPEIVIQKLLPSTTLDCQEDPDNNDYILSTKEAVELKGSKYANKRKTINRLLNNYKDSIIVSELNLLNHDTIAHIKNLNARWTKQSPTNNGTPENDIPAINIFLENYSNISKNSLIYSLGVYINNRLEAYCIYEKLNNVWAISHFGKASREIKGAYEYLMVEVLRDLHKRNIAYLNYEQDLGIPGLKQSKLGNKPVKFLKKYIIRDC